MDSIRVSKSIVLFYIPISFILYTYLKSENLSFFINLDLGYLIEQLSSLFHGLHILDAEETLVVPFLQHAILNMGGGVGKHTREHLAAIERT